MDPLGDLMSRDAYAVLPPQPLGDYLQAIVEALRKQGEQVEGLGKSVEELSGRVSGCEGEVNGLGGRMAACEVGIENVGEAVLQVKEGGLGDRVERLEKEVRGRVEERLQVVEKDLERPVDHHLMSDPASLTLELPYEAFLQSGGKPALCASLAGKIGVQPDTIHLLGEPTPTEDDHTSVTFRLRFLTPPREPAEGLLAALMGRFSAGSAGGIMNAPVTNPTRPPLNTVSPKTHLAKTTFTIQKSVATMMCRQREMEFWLHHARRYFKRLRKFKKKRWSGTEAACGRFLTDNLKVLGAGYYRKLVRYVAVSKRTRARSRAAKYLASQTQSGLVRVYHKKALEWLETVHAVKKRAAKREKAVRYLMGSTSAGLLRVYQHKAVQWVTSQRATNTVKQQKCVGAAENLLITTNRGTRLRCYKTWKKLVKARKTRRATVDGLAGVNDRVLVGKYLAKLLLFRAVGKSRRLKFGQVDVLAVLNEKVLLGKYYRKLSRFAKLIRKLRKRRGVQHKLAGELEGRSVKMLVMRSFGKLRNFARERGKGRERELLGKLTEMVGEEKGDDPRVGEIGKKCDELNTQVDVSLKTLTNTNSVLNKLVDRLISVDEQLDHLDKEKVSRKELGTISASVPTSDTAKSKPQPFSELPPNIPPSHHKHISPPRTRGDEKEAEHWRLLQQEKARLVELTAQPTPSRWDSFSSVTTAPVASHPHPLPSTEDTLSRARQWQRDRANLTPVREGGFPTSTPTPSIPHGWRLT